jgi:hypothetical protein
MFAYPTDKPIKEMEKRISLLKRSLALCCMPLPFSETSPFLYVNEHWVDFVYKSMKDSLYGFKIMPTQDDISIGASKNYGETHPRNPGAIYMFDPDLMDINMNDMLGFSLINSYSDDIIRTDSYNKKSNDNDACVVNRILEEAVLQLITYPGPGYKDKEEQLAWKRFNTHATVITFPWRHQTNREDRKYGLYQPRGSLLISADSRSAGTFSDTDTFEDTARELEEGRTGCTMRSDIARFTFQQGPNIEDRPNWELNRKATEKKYIKDPILNAKFPGGHWRTDMFKRQSDNRGID